MNDLRASGFSTVILWTIHVDANNGDLILNDQKVVSNGAYVGRSAWPSELATLKQEPTSVRRIEVGIASWGVDDFGSIKKLMTTYGTNTTSILYRNFKALKTATGADALNLDDEVLYDVATTVKFSLMCASMGYKISLCPYTQQSFWSSCMSQINSQAPGTVDAVFLQCYDGGAWNDPASWNGSFGSLKMIPGLWCKHGNGCSDGDNPGTVASKLAAWKKSTGISGGFMWLYDDMRSCTSEGVTADYARAINSVFLLPAPSGLSAIAGDRSVFLTWNTLAGAAKYTVKRSTSATGLYTTVATNVVSTYYEDRGLTTGTRYYYEVCGVDANGDGLVSTPVSIVPCSGALPPGWIDIGTAATAGTADYCSGTFTFHASGMDIGGAGDDCNFASIAAAGDSALIAWVAFIGGSDPAAKAGVMFRNDASSNSASVVLVATPGQGLWFQTRTAAGAVSSNSVPGVTLPVWLQIVRSGSTFLAYYAADGVNWTQAGGATVEMGTSALSGLAVASHDGTNTVLALFDGVSQGAPTIWQQPTPTRVTRYPGASCSFSASASAALPATYGWTRDGTNVAGANRTTLVFTNLSVSDSGMYALVASNGFGCATSSAAILTVMEVKNSLFPRTVVSNRPVGFWRLNETTTKTAYDYFGGNDGSYTNVLGGQAGYTTSDRAARFGYTVAANSYVNVPGVNFANTTNGAFSIEAWVNGGAQTNDAGVVTKGTGAGGEQFNLDCGGTGHGFRFFVRDAGGTAHLASTGVAPNGKWHHLVGVCDEKNSKVILYVDGTNAAQGTITAGTGVLSSSSPMTIGSRQSGAATAFDLQFKGYIADVAVYNSALSAAQVLAHYNVVTNRPPTFATAPITAPDASAGQLYTWTLSGLATDVNGGAIVYSKSGGPDWLTISANGTVSGTPLSVDTGLNYFEAAATDVTGLVGTATLSLNVTEAPPITASIVGGTNVVLSWTGGIPPYTVQCATNIDTPDWQAIGGPVDGGSISVTATNGVRFYRVMGR